MTDERTPLNTNTHNTARTAFEEADAEASRAFHDTIQKASEDGHQTEGGMVKPIIFGGLDGILTSFAIVAGAAGGNLSPQVVLILGFSNIFADAL
jgi:DNA damage-binding protein 1